MNVNGIEVSEESLARAFQNLPARFRATNFVYEAERCGVEKLPAYRAVDRYLQKLRRAGGISFSTRTGMWTKSGA